MNAKSLFLIVAVIILLFGLGLTFAPTFMADYYLTNPSWINAEAKFLAQGWGSLLLTAAVACWYVRDAGRSSGNKVMLLFLLLSNLTLIVIHIMAVLSGVETALGWVQALLSTVVATCSEMLFRQADRVIV